MRIVLNHPKLKKNRRKLRRDQTEAEKRLWSRLRAKQLGFKFYRQYGVGPFIVDFFCHQRSLVVELDGGQHNESEGRKLDQDRDEYFRKNGLTVLRLWNHEVLENIEGVVEKIYLVLGNSL